MGRKTDMTYGVVAIAVLGGVFLNYLISEKKQEKLIEYKINFGRKVLHSKDLDGDGKADLKWFEFRGKYYVESDSLDLRLREE